MAVRMQLCLKCARQEHDMNRTTCKDCGGTLWGPVQGVGGRVGNDSVDEAIRLIRSGRKPWSGS